MPANRITSKVSVVAVRVSTAATAHHDSTGICARSSEFTSALQRRDFDLDAGEALHQRDIAERVGGGLGKIGIMPLDRVLHRSALRMTRRVSTVKTTHSTSSGSASRQLSTSDAGSSTTDEDEGGEMLAKERHPQPPQRIGAGEHDFHLPAGMGAGVIGERQLQHVLEEIRQHQVAAAMREPVGEPATSAPAMIMNRPKPTQAPTSGASARAAGASAGGQRAGQRVDDVAEQDRLDEFRDGQRDIGERQRYGETRLRRQQAKHAQIDA